MEAANDLILSAIRAGATAGGLRFWARQTPDAARGLNKAADSYSRQSKAALDRAMTRLGFADPGLRQLWS